MIHTAALIGGPKAGEVWHVQDGRTLRVLLPPADMFSADWDKVIEPEEVIYERRTLSFFGAPMHVWCAPEFMGDPTNEAVAQVAAHILNPLGLTLLREAAQ